MSEYFRRHIKKEHYTVHPSNLRFKTLFKNCVLDALRRRQWKETDDAQDWDIYWAEKEAIPEVMDHMHLNNNQRVNHFRNHYELTRKDLMIKNLKRHKKQLEKEGKLDEAASYSFFPLTYNLPGEYSLFCEEFKKNSNVWIMKPIGKSQGKGIFLFNKLNQIGQWKNDFRWKPDSPQSEPYVVQKYINNPLIIGGKKFDMRIYCLCTSYSPLVVYLYRTGFARFTHHRYDNDDITNTYVHLTNVAIQKDSENYDANIGGKWELRTLKLYLISKFGQEKVSECFSNIQQLIIRALQSCQKVIINDKHCFELYGFDVLLDSNLKPWLLEINASPSMTANTAHDQELKVNLLDDVFTIIDIEKIMTGQEEQIGGFDLIYKGNPIKLPSSSTYSTLLGCYNNRGQQLKKLAKSTAVRLAQTQTQEDNKKKTSGGPRDKETASIGSVSTTDTSTNLGKPRAKTMINTSGSTQQKNNPQIGAAKPKINTNIPLYKPPVSNIPNPQGPGVNRVPRDADKILKPKPRDNSKSKTTVSPTIPTNPVGTNNANPMISSNGYGMQNTITKQNSLLNTNANKNQMGVLQQPSYAKGTGNTTVSTLVSSGMLTLADPLKFKNMRAGQDTTSISEKDVYNDSIGMDTDKNSTIITPKQVDHHGIARSYTYSYGNEKSIEANNFADGRDRKISNDNLDQHSKDIEDNLMLEDSEEEDPQNNE